MSAPACLRPFRDQLIALPWPGGGCRGGMMPFGPGGMAWRMRGLSVSFAVLMALVAAAVLLAVGGLAQPYHQIGHLPDADLRPEAPRYHTPFLWPGLASGLCHGHGLHIAPRGAA